MTQDRVTQLLSPFHLLPIPTMSAQYASNASGSGKSKVLAKNPDDVVIVSAVRSAITKVGAPSRCLAAMLTLVSGKEGWLQGHTP